MILYHLRGMERVSRFSRPARPAKVDLLHHQRRSPRPAHKFGHTRKPVPSPYAELVWMGSTTTILHLKQAEI